MLDGIKEALAPTEDEWKVIQPKVEKVMELQGQTRVSMMRRGGSDQAPRNDVEKAAQELRAVLANAEATQEQIKEKLAAFRAAMDKVKSELAQAQEALREVLTLKQEAQLVARGLLN